jgi:hypothetical protein
MGLMSGLIDISDVTDAFGLTDSGAGKKAAKKAGQASEVGLGRARDALNAQQQPAIDNMWWGGEQARGQMWEGGERALGNITQYGQQGMDAFGAGNRAAIGRLDPMANMGMEALNQYQQGSTAAGYGRNINELMSGGALDPLIASNRRGIEAELSAQGLGRSGYGVTELSQLPVNTAMGIENQLQSRRGNVMNSTLPSITNQANLESQYGAGMADIYGGMGSAMANLETNRFNNMANNTNATMQNIANTQLGLGQNLANLETGNAANQSSAILAGAQAEAADRAALGNMVGTAAGVAMSDIRLKDNIEKTGNAGDLSIYTWDWNEEGQRLTGEKSSTGFIAQEVEVIYPQHMREVAGFKAIDYASLINELESKNANFSKH